ncbi:hypothetical protein J6590_013025 [Homalodisca vitripennis]|nr:hypothetical protein J6590_013025 [Homalodisca vitripennis]
MWRGYCSVAVYVPFSVFAMAWLGEHRTNRVSTKKKINWPTSYCNNTGECGASENIHPTVSKAVKQAAALGLSERSVRKILHKELQLHPYKIMVAQKLSEEDYETRRAACDDILQNIPPDAVFNSTNNHYTAQK